jgi:hypothetical protein
LGKSRLVRPRRRPRGFIDGDSGARALNGGAAGAVGTFRMTNVTRMLLPLLFCSLTAALAGCGGSGPLPTAGDSATELVAQETAGEQLETVDPTHTTRDPSIPVCMPRSVQECRWYYKDGAGHTQCPMSYQICELDGHGWTACGEFLLDQTGNIIPR